MPGEVRQRDLGTGPGLTVATSKRVGCWRNIAVTLIDP